MNRIHYKDLRVRLTKEEHSRIVNYANECGLTISNYVRKRLHDEPLIQCPTQGVLEHFRALQDFRFTLRPLMNRLSDEEYENISRDLDELVGQGKRLV